VYTKRVRRSFWFVLGGCIVLWIILGIALDPEKVPVDTLFDIVSLGAFFTSFAFVVVYTAAGLIGPKPRSRWWKNEVGTYLVLAFASVMLIVGPPAFAVMFNGGLINTWWWAWCWIGGHAMAAIMIGSLAFLWIQKSLEDRKIKREISSIE